MSKSKTNYLVNWKIAAFVLAIVLLCAYFLIQKYGVLRIALGLCAVPALFFIYNIVKQKRRRSALNAKYSDKKLVEDIEQGYFWKGQTAEQLTDSLGIPEDIDEKVLKTKIKCVWKYNHLGGNRYGLRITLDDDIVTGWDQKE